MSRSHKGKDSYSATEVGPLIESFRNDISVIAEGQVALQNGIDILKTDIREIKDRLILVEDTIRISLPDIYSRVNRLKTKVFHP